MRQPAAGRALFAAMLFVAVRTGAQCPDGTPPPCAARRAAPLTRAVPSPDARARRFLLLPFRNVTRIATQDWLVTGAPLMLGESLRQFQDLTVVTEDKLTAARRRLSIRADSQPDVTQLRRLAEETDGWTAVSGNVYAAGPRLRITVQATDVPTSRVIAEGKTEISVDADVRQAFDSLTVLLLAPTGVRGARADLAALTTQSADAYRAYVRGIGLLQQSAFHRAEQAFTEAVTLDSTFALAWTRLAYATASGNLATLIDPASPAMRALERSARLGTRLPARQLEFIHAMQYFSRGQMKRAKHTLDSLVVTDRDDLDSREVLGLWQVSDFDLDTVPGPARMASSMNRGMRLAREVLDRDPGRRNVHSVFAMGYALSAGWWLGMRLGVRGEFTSFAASIARLAMAGPDAAFVPVLRDSIVLVPIADFLRLPGAERARLRRQGADAGMEWVERWLLDGPQDAEAHLWASRFAELRDDAPRALRELAVAESLGVESAMENLPQRRLELLVRAERLSAAAALADSFVTSGILRKRRFGDARLDFGRGYAAAAFLLNRRWADAGTLVASLGPSKNGAQCADVLGELSNSTDEVSGAALRALADTVANNVMSVAAIQPLAPCLGTLVLLVTDSTAGRRAFAGAALMAVADSLHRAGGNDTLAYRAAAWAWAVDSTRHAAISERAWFGARARTLAFGRHFVPASATVEGDSAVFGFRLNATAAAEPTESADSLEWSLRMELSDPQANSAVTLTLVIGSATAGDRAIRSGAPDRVAAMRVRTAQDMTSLVTNRTTSTASMRAMSDGFVVVVRGSFVSFLRKTRPPTAMFFAGPCVAVSDGLCGQPAIPVVYR